jgi:hypothetical protein
MVIIWSSSIVFASNFFFIEISGNLTTGTEGLFAAPDSNAVLRLLGAIYSLLIDLKNKKGTSVAPK